MDQNTNSDFTTYTQWTKRADHNFFEMPQIQSSARGFLSAPAIFQ